MTGNGRRKMIVSVLAELLNKYCIMEQINTVAIKDGIVTVLSSRVVNVNKNSVQYILRTLKYNEVYSQWECVFTDYSEVED